MGISQKDYLEKIFNPIKNIATNRDGVINIGDLKTAPLEDYWDDEYTTAQYRRLRELKIDKSHVSYLSNGDFFTYFECDQQHYLCVSCEFLTREEQEKLSDILKEHSAIECFFEECFFLSFCYYLEGTYKPKINLSADLIEQTLGLGAREFQEEYRGHAIDELIEVYTPVLIYEVGVDSILTCRDNWFLALTLTLEVERLQSALIDRELVSLASDLYNLGSVHYENIYLSLTSSHYKYIFIEIYRCLEAIYYLPWMLNLKSGVGIQHDAYSLAGIVANAIKWREKEKESISSLFALLPEAIFNSSSLSNISFLSNKNYEQEDCRRSLSMDVYRVRNQSVHQADYEHKDNIVLNVQDWQLITKFMYRVVKYFYSEYKKDISVYEHVFILGSSKKGV
ncbi:hypothetical protein [Zobellella denitrificans]|uniref:hypothetical protein n=1 Tax=Zobellella denitrificans TaxID=347534 RepID=UPI0012FDDC20|nr:hypothetical protein [Zobellella denitrificans]